MAINLTAVPTKSHTFLPRTNPRRSPLFSATSSSFHIVFRPAHFFSLSSESCGIESWELLKTGSKVATAAPNVFSRGSGRPAVTSRRYVITGVEEEKYKGAETPSTTITIFDFYGRLFIPRYFARSF
jgi:hypothetical protein